MKSKKIEEAEMMHKLGIDPSQSRWKKWKWIIFIVLFSIIIAAIAGSRNKAGQGVMLSRFKTKVVETGPLTITVSATGKLKPTNTVDVGSELSGIAKTVEAQFNEHVKKGQVLATIDASFYEAQVMQSRASLESAQTQVLTAQANEKDAISNMNRLKEVWALSGNKVPSKTDLDKAETDLQRAQASLANTKAQVSQCEAALNQNETNLTKLVIKSPVDGIVLSRKIEPGQTVVGSNFQAIPIFSLAQDLSSMELHVDVDEADVGKVKENQEATFTVSAYPDKTFNARVTQVRYNEKESNGVVTYETLLKVENKDLLLRPGMTATAKIVVNKLEKAILIDNAARRFVPSEMDLAANSNQKTGFFKRIFSRSKKPAAPDKDKEAEEIKDKKTKKVWALNDNVLSPITITIGLSDGVKTEVTSGDLKTGMMLVTGTASEIK
jgi:HlyD family secretion protein